MSVNRKSTLFVVVVATAFSSLSIRVTMVTDQTLLRQNPLNHNPLSLLMGRLGSVPRLVGRTGSGVWVSASYQKKSPNSVLRQQKGGLRSRWILAGEGFTSYRPSELAQFSAPQAASGQVWWALSLYHGDYGRKCHVPSQVLLLDAVYSRPQSPRLLAVSRGQRMLRIGSNNN